MNKPQPDDFATARVHKMTERAPGGPAVLRILLGAQLRRLREDRSISREDAGYEIRASDSKMSRLERGRVGFKERDVADLLTLYGVHDAEKRDAVLELARRANAPVWWHSYSDVVHSWFEVYVGLEDGASRIRTYELQFVPGLLQTEEYARAVTVLGHQAAAPDEVDRRVELRLNRQRVLTRPGAPHYWVVVDEAALRRPLGEPGVMRRQLERLIEGAMMPNVTLQVVPFMRGGHAAAGGQFSILRFAEPDLPDIVYMEQLTSAVYLDKREDVDRYLAVMEQLCVEAAPPNRTVAILKEIMNSF
jgi:transcriptional regulator with XRE-family HTH domain